MKKRLLILPVLTILALSGCKNDDDKEYSFVVPTGAPAIAMSDFADERNFQTVTDPSTIVPMMASEQVDVAVLPTNVGATAITTKGLPYKMLCTITFGNFYIAATGHDDDGVMDADDYIVSFQQGAVPDKIFHYVHGNDFDNALHYVSSAQEAAKCLKTGKNLADESKAVDYVLLAEPALTTVLNTTPTASLYEDLQSKYKEKSNGLILPQASVFVKSSFKRREVMRKIYDDLKESIDEYLSEPESLQDSMDDVNDPVTVFGVKPEVAVEVTKNGNRMGIGCKLASEIKDDVNNFLSIFGMSGLKDENIW